MPEARLVVIADDLTSAAEVAGRLGSSSKPAIVMLEPFEDTPHLGDDHVCLVTETRGLDAAEAAQRTWRCVERHVAGRPSPSVVIKTIDSSLRGNWAAELAAVMNSLSVSLAVVAPAFPAYGRVTRAGMQFAEGLPVHAGPAGLDPVTPVTESRVAWHAERAGLDVIEIDRPSSDGGSRLRALLAATHEQPTVVVVDVEDGADLEELARHAKPRRDVVWCAGPGLAMAIVDQLAPARPVALPPSTHALAVIGSLHPTTRAQVEHARELGVPVTVLGTYQDADLVAGREVLQALADNSRAVVCSPLHLAERPNDHLASVTAQVARALPGAAFVLSGGDTAAAACRHMGSRAIEVIGEWGTGIPIGHFSGEHEAVVVTKAGGFGGVDALSELLRDLTPQIVGLGTTTHQRKGP